MRLLRRESALAAAQGQYGAYQEHCREAHAGKTPAWAEYSDHTSPPTGAAH